MEDDICVKTWRKNRRESRKKNRYLFSRVTKRLDSIQLNFYFYSNKETNIQRILYLKRINKNENMFLYLILQEKFDKTLLFTTKFS